jgi:hypothetical protein
LKAPPKPRVESERQTGWGLSRKGESASPGLVPLLLAVLVVVLFAIGLYALER